MNISISDLKNDGRAYVHYPKELRDAVEHANDAWEKFCALPEELKLRFPYSDDAKVSGNGYELKKDSNAGDLKEDFHLRENVADWLRENARMVDDTVAPAFIDAVLAIPPLMAPIVREFARTVESDLKVEGFEEDVMNYQPKWLIRFLHYFPGIPEGDEIAAPHVDKGGFTLHLYESNGGVERLDYTTREWVPMPLSHDETVIIPGNGIHNRSKGQLRGLCHRVVADAQTEKQGRYAAVCFFNFDHCRFFNKEKFGRQQDYAPGFFYDMPFEEYDQYFID